MVIVQATASLAADSGLSLVSLQNPVWVSKANMRNPSVIKSPDGYRLFYSRFSAPTSGWGDPKHWHIAEVFTKDFVRFENDRDLSPDDCASPGMSTKSKQPHDSDPSPIRFSLPTRR